MVELVGIGDLHFNKLDSLIPNASELVCSSVARVLNYALDKGIRDVVFYGDICEKPRMSYEAQCLFYKLLLRERYSELKFHFILGNHDFAEDGTHSLQVLDVISSAIGKGIQVYTQPTRTTLRGVSFNFLPYPHTTTTKNAINVGHFEVKGSLRDNGRKIDDGVDTQHVTLMGHLHTCHSVRNTHYSGTLYQTNFGESLPKSFHHVTAESHRPEDVNIINVPFSPPFRLLNLTVTKASDLNGLDDPSKGTLYKLFLKDGVDLDVGKILDTYPNIVRHNTFKNKKDLELMTTQSWEFDDDIVNDNVNVDNEAIALDFLAKSGFKQDKIDRGRDILRSILGKT